MTSILCDAVQTVSVHNGVVRVVLGRLDAEGKLISALELLMPVGQVASLAKAIMPVTRGAQQ